MGEDEERECAGVEEWLRRVPALVRVHGVDKLDQAGDEVRGGAGGVLEARLFAVPARLLPLNLETLAEAPRRVLQVALDCLPVLDVQVVERVMELYAQLAEANPRKRKRDEQARVGSNKRVRWEDQLVDDVNPLVAKLAQLDEQKRLVAGTTASAVDRTLGELAGQRIEAQRSPETAEQVMMEMVVTALRGDAACLRMLCWTVLYLHRSSNSAGASALELGKQRLFSLNRQGGLLDELLSSCPGSGTPPMVDRELQLQLCAAFPQYRHWRLGHLTQAVVKLAEDVRARLQVRAWLVELRAMKLFGAADMSRDVDKCLAQLVQAFSISPEMGPRFRELVRDVERCGGGGGDASSDKFV